MLPSFAAVKEDQVQLLRAQVPLLPYKKEPLPPRKQRLIFPSEQGCKVSQSKYCSLGTPLNWKPFSTSLCLATSKRNFDGNNFKIYIKVRPWDVRKDYQIIWFCFYQLVCEMIQNRIMPPSKSSLFKCYRAPIQYVLQVSRDVRFVYLSNSPSF